ncbi:MULTISPECIES: hypothetical protein [Saccharopolyspora]|uniref:PE family protein n=1 Tax=Saccharopolyspora cebuensis TaxID=418759 RepID=A0ABV4CIS6_9PSEU
MAESAGAVAGLAAANEAMMGIINAANGGRFQVTPEAGEELIRIFEDMGEEMRGMWQDLDLLKQKVPLGPSPAGQEIAHFDRLVAAGDDGRSYEEMLRQLRSRVPEVVEAIRKGIELYQEVDDGNSRRFDVQA